MRKYQHRFQFTLSYYKCLNMFKLLKVPTIAEMTCRGMAFALRVEEMLSGISKPQYRQIVVEVTKFTSTLTIIKI